MHCEANICNLTGIGNADSEAVDAGNGQVSTLQEIERVIGQVSFGQFLEQGSRIWTCHAQYTCTVCDVVYGDVKVHDVTL